MKCKDIDFLNIIKDLLDNDIVNSLKLYKHHYSSNRLEHSISVAYLSYRLCKFLNLDYVSVARAGVLHDLFLYDCENPQTKPKKHISTHPKVALTNAEQLFNLNNLEKDIILKHMWPITISPPRYIETLIVTFVDKYCALKEWINYCTFKNRYRTEKNKHVINKTKKEPPQNFWAGTFFTFIQRLLQLLLLELVFESLLVLRLQLL